jgi:hypothetical protein
MHASVATIDTFDVVPFELAHFDLIVPQEHQRDDYELYAHCELTRELILAGQAWTAFRGERCLGSAGLMPLRPRCATVWSVIDRNVRNHEFLRVHRATAQYLERAMAQYARVEFCADLDFKQAQRWARLLNFDLEGVYVRFKPVKRKYAIYVRGEQA